jgi:hypothetical protein
MTQENNENTKKITDELKNSVITTDFSPTHCFGIRWNAIYKIKSSNKGIKIYYAWNGQGGTETVEIPFDKELSENEAQIEFIKKRDKFLKNMLSMMNKNGELES